MTMRTRQPRSPKTEPNVAQPARALRTPPPTTTTAPLRGAKAPTGIKTCGYMPVNVKDPPRQPGESNQSYAFVRALRATPSTTASR